MLVAVPIFAIELEECGSVWFGERGFYDNHFKKVANAVETCD